MRADERTCPPGIPDLRPQSTTRTEGDRTETSYDTAPRPSSNRWDPELQPILGAKDSRPNVGKTELPRTPPCVRVLFERCDRTACPIRADRIPRLCVHASSSLPLFPCVPVRIHQRILRSIVDGRKTWFASSKDTYAPKDGWEDVGNNAFLAFGACAMPDAEPGKRVLEA